MKLIEDRNLQVQWDEMSQTPFIDFPDPPTSEHGGSMFQLWYDNPKSLRLKYELVQELGLRGAGMWNADTLDYGSSGGEHETRAMWEALNAMNE